MPSKIRRNEQSRGPIDRTKLPQPEPPFKSVVGRTYQQSTGRSYQPGMSIRMIAPAEATRRDPWCLEGNHGPQAENGWARCEEDDRETP